MQTNASGWTILVRLLVGLVVFLPEGIQKLIFPGHCHVNWKFAGQLSMSATVSRCDCRVAPCQHSLSAK